MKSRTFRYGFLVLFFIMFFQVLWTFKLLWNWAYHGTMFHSGAAQFTFGFYSVMLTSTVLGLITIKIV